MGSLCWAGCEKGAYWQMTGNLMVWVGIDKVVLSHNSLTSSKGLNLALHKALSASVLDSGLIVLGIWVVLTVGFNCTCRFEIS